MTEPSGRVDYLASARRHAHDAGTLDQRGARPNAGQLYGLSVECALKALLVRLGAATEADGTIAAGLRAHLPRLANDLAFLPDGRPASALHGAVPHLSKMHDWRIEYRYWRAADIPLASLPHWRSAAREMLAHLDEIL